MNLIGSKVCFFEQLKSIFLKGSILEENYTKKEKYSIKILIVVNFCLDPFMDWDRGMKQPMV